MAVREESCGELVDGELVKEGELVKDGELVKEGVVGEGRSSW